MNKWLTRIIIILAVLIFVVVDLYVIRPRMSKQAASNSSPAPSTSQSPTALEAAKKQFSLDDKIVLASYYGWYYKSKTWAQETKAEHPMAGSYDPSEDKTIEYQLSLAKDLDLDGFIYSWNGNKFDDTTLVKMLEKVETTPEYATFKIAVLYENVSWQNKDPNSRFIQELSYLNELAKKHPAFLKLNGLPVIFVYNPQGIPAKSWKEIWNGVRTNSGEAYLIAMPDNWEVGDDYFEYFHTITTYADKFIGLDSISSHYDALKKGNHPLIGTLIGGTSRIQKNGYDIDRSNGQYLNARYDIAKKNSANWLYVTSWNEWYEFAQIEPSTESNFETAKYLRQIIGNFKGKKVQGPSAKLTVKNGKVINSGPSDVYFIRCVPEDQSAFNIFLLKPHQEESIGQYCKKVSGWLVDNTKIHN